jgi:hypothetical protein
MPHVNAYVLAGDPTWLRESVRAYYPHIERLIVSFDSEERGWTGARLRVRECLDILKSIDVDGKIDWAPGHFSSGAAGDYVAADTKQRCDALRRAEEGADWVLQIDTDEVLPRWSPFEALLRYADEQGLSAVEWPLRVLFRHLSGDRYLEIVTDAGTTHFEYPGPVAVKPGVELVECRRTNSEFVRPIVMGDEFSLQIRGAAVTGEHRVEVVEPDDAIWHNSWGRSPAVVRRKVAAWSHNQGLRSWAFYYAVWLPSPLTWRALRHFHPLHRPLWARTRPVSAATVLTNG